MFLILYNDKICEISSWKVFGNRAENRTTFVNATVVINT